MFRLITIIFASFILAANCAYSHEFQALIRQGGS